jgi:superfamily II DNA or RNA helicase
MGERAQGAFQVGSLVRARGRTWIVLPSDEPDLLRLKPVTGADDTPVGLFLPLERSGIETASFAPPNPESVGDPAASRVLFDAARLLLRSSAAPFRCAGRLSFTPRPYQFVPLIMALRQDPVRLLIADDVGVGKTIEAGMIARELLDRGTINRILVLCPAHLCDQWAQELTEKFGLEPAVVQPANLGRLQRELPPGDISIYDHYPCLVASIDFVKSETHKHLLLNSAPGLVIVDEAHLATRPRGSDPTGNAQQQRYSLVRELAADPSRNIVLVTATPHSGVPENFRSLLGILNPSFDVDPAHPAREPTRQRLVPHIVQRRRADVVKWLGGERDFPERVRAERPYSLSDEYRTLYKDVLAYCQGTLERSASMRAAQQRVRRWAALSMLRSLLSSPAAAEVALADKRRTGEPEPAASSDATAEETDESYRIQVINELFPDSANDSVPSAPLADSTGAWTDTDRRRRAEFAGRIRAIVTSGADTKLDEAVDVVRALLKGGFRPIVFCHFIPTAKYVADGLRQRLHSEFSGLQVAAVTGNDPDDVRRENVGELGKHPHHVLVATDCLSEGINLQEHFDAVVHYDLPWNPNRLEQREGRVDRFGQRREEVRAVTLWGRDSEIDQFVRDVLFRKAEQIRHDLGIAVPVPAGSEHLIEAVVDNVLLRRPTGQQLQLGLATPEVRSLHDEWDRSAAREKENRTYYAQPGIHPDEVLRELEATDHVLGDTTAVRRFLAESVQRFGGALDRQRSDGIFLFKPGDLEQRLPPEAGIKFPARVTFDRIKDPDTEAIYLGRMHPIVEETAHAVLGRAFSTEPGPFFARAGASFTRDVEVRTAVLLLRIRYVLREKKDNFAEEVILAAFEPGDGSSVRWLEPLADRAEAILAAPLAPVNMPLDERRGHVRWALQLLSSRPDLFKPVLDARRGEIQASHNRLRGILKQGDIEVRPDGPDILGCYVMVPAGSASR